MGGGQPAVLLGATLSERRTGGHLLWDVLQPEHSHYRNKWPKYHTTTTVLRPFFRDHPGEPVPDENFWTLWYKGRLTEAETPTSRLGATPSRLTSAHLHHPPWGGGSGQSNLRKRPPVCSNKSNTWFLEPTRVHNPNGISIGSVVFAGLTTVTDRQTDRQTDHATPSVNSASTGRIYARSTAMRHKIRKSVSAPSVTAYLLNM